MKGAFYVILGIVAFVAYGIATTPVKSIEERCSERFALSGSDMIEQCVTTAKIIKAHRLLDQRDADIRSIAGE